MVSSDNVPSLSVVWDPETILCFTGSEAPASARLMVSQLTSSDEAISPPVLVTEASALVSVSHCEIITVRLARLDQGDFINQ